MISQAIIEINGIVYTLGFWAYFLQLHTAIVPIIFGPIKLWFHSLWDANPFQSLDHQSALRRSVGYLLKTEIWLVGSDPRHLEIERNDHSNNAVLQQR